LTTIKLNKKPDDTQVKASKAPVRRTDAAKRDRSVAPPKASVSVRTNIEPATQPEKQEPSARAPANQVPPKTGQRNHRFDGKSHQSDRSTQENSSNPEVHERKPYTSKPDDARRSEPRQPIQSREPRPRGVDTRTTPKPNKEEPQYRQAPRRGGKVRDGYDATDAVSYGPAARAAYKSTSANVELPRLSKRMAELGICSRREADEWIVNGWVMVDGVIIDTLGSRINPDAEIIISSYAKEVQAETVTILLHKPVGYVSGQAEDGYQPAIVLVHPDNEWLDDPNLNQHHAKEFQRGFLHGLAPAGRLDIDSTGLLVLTQDGRIARHLIGEDSSVEKEYLVRVEGELSDADMKRLNFGLSLDGEKLKPAKVSWQNEDQLRFVLREGKKRQIRRMCEMVGLHVVGLKRVRIGSVNLGKLPLGQWRYLRNDERF
jgi:23S rRNA pseudouridine2604 synthase